MYIIYAFFFLLSLCVPATASQGAKAALFPLEDLSQGAGSLQGPFSERVAEEIRGRGLEIIPAEQVRSFMSRHRIRNLGFLSTAELHAAAEELGVAFAILGTISQNQATPPALGVTLSLLSTSDGLTVWSASHGVSLYETQGFLGISTPKSHEDLFPILVRNLLADFSWKIPDNSPAAPPSDVLEVDAILLEPRCVKPGQQIKGSARVRLPTSMTAPPQIFFKVGSHVYTGELSGAGRVEAQWSGIEEHRGNPARTAALGTAADSVFKQVVEDADAHPLQEVYLVVKMPDGTQQQFLLGSYEVDSQAPAIAMTLKGIEYNGGLIFRDTLPIAVRQEKRHEPISRWELIISKPEAETVLKTSGPGLPDRLVWNGLDGHGAPLPGGTYRIALKVWDRAGNEAAVSQDVGFFPSIPAPQVTATVTENRLSAVLEGTGGLPPAYWRFEVWSPDNELIQQREGDHFPETVEVPWAVSPDANGKFRGVLLVRDILGNQQRRVFDDLAQLAAARGRNVEATGPSAKAWIPDF